MKKIILVLVILLCMNISCSAQQIISIEKAGEYLSAGQAVPEGTTYIKDLNNVLDKYIGTWKGTYNNLNYEVRFVKYTNHFLLDEDVLSMRYKIVNNGVVIEDTTTLLDTNPLVIHGNYLQRNTYILTYSGREWNCGQTGNIFIEALKSSNLTKMKLFLMPDQEFINPNECPNGAVNQVFPKSAMILTKQ